MVDTTKIKKLAKAKGMNLILVKKRKQLSGVGVIWDFDVSGGRITRLAIAEYRHPRNSSANIYYDDSSKTGIDFKTESELVRYMEKYN